MKKIILSTVALFIAFSAMEISANETMPVNKEIEIVEASGLTTFCKLIQKGDYETVKELIQRGENVNKRSNGMTPLMFAARHNKAKIAKLLIENGAKLKSKCYTRKMTALEYAKTSKATEAYDVIKEAIDK